MKKRIGGLFLLCMAIASLAAAETIYTWTDAEGTKRFSNSPPPEGVKTFQKQTVRPSDDATQSPGQRRSSFDRMVENATAESNQLEQRRQAAKAAAQQREAEMEQKQQDDARRKHLEEQIEAIRKRGLSPTYSKGMRDAQIKKIQQQIDQSTQSGEKQKSDERHDGY